MNVGFAGLGRMGAAMAHRLLSNGVDLIVHNRSESRAGSLIEAGAKWAASPAELGASADVIFTILADDAAVREVLGGTEGLIASAHPGTVIVEMSTVSPATMSELAQLGAQTGVLLLDAPVSGSVPAAEKGALTYVLGGDAGAIERVSPLLDILAAKRFHVGSVGAGATMKLALNAIVAVTNQAISEALVLAERAGIDSDTAYDVLENSAIASPFLAVKRSGYLSPDDVPVLFTVNGMRKDVGLIGELADRSTVPLPAVDGARRGLDWAQQGGAGEEDFAIVAEFLRAHAGGAAARRGSKASVSIDETTALHAPQTRPLTGRLTDDT